MRVLLVQFGTRTQEKPIFPLGLSYLASVLDRHEVRIFDQNTVPAPSEDLRKDLLSEVVYYVPPYSFYISFQGVEDALQDIENY